MTKEMGIVRTKSPIFEIQVIIFVAGAAFSTEINVFNVIMGFLFEPESKRYNGYNAKQALKIGLHFQVWRIKITFNTFRFLLFKKYDFVLFYFLIVTL